MPSKLHRIIFSLTSLVPIVTLLSIVFWGSLQAWLILYAVTMTITFFLLLKSIEKKTCRYPFNPTSEAEEELPCFGLLFTYLVPAIFSVASGDSVYCLLFMIPTVLVSFFYPEKNAMFLIFGYKIYSAYVNGREFTVLSKLKKDKYIVRCVTDNVLIDIPEGKKKDKDKNREEIDKKIEEIVRNFEKPSSVVSVGYYSVLPFFSNRCRELLDPIIDKKIEGYVMHRDGTPAGDDVYMTMFSLEELIRKSIPSLTTDFFVKAINPFPRRRPPKKPPNEISKKNTIFVLTLLEIYRIDVKRISVESDGGYSVYVGFDAIQYGYKMFRPSPRRVGADTATYSEYRIVLDNDGGVVVRDMDVDCGNIVECEMSEESILWAMRISPMFVHGNDLCLDPKVLVIDKNV